MYHENEPIPMSARYRGFLIAAVVLSILFHIFFAWWALSFHPPRFGDVYFDQIVPRKFRVERVEIDPASLTEPAEPSTPATAQVIPVDIPEEAMVPEFTRSAPPPSQIDPSNLPKTDTNLPSEFSSALEAVRGNATSNMASDLNDIRNQLVEAEPTSPSRPVLNIPETGPTGEGDGLPGLRMGQLQGYSQLDDLLKQTGPLAPGTDPIFMPGDLLFDYNRVDLREEALLVLQQLGTLIQRNPKTLFWIEGHTDSFGSDEYNQGLSELRAESVKSWLVGEMGVPPDRIRTRGFGKNRLLVPAQESIENQRLNRRVEIVLEEPE